jgi:hypothetical protein
VHATDGVPAADAARDRRIRWWLALAALAVFGITARGYVDNMDSQIQFTAASRLLDTGSMSLTGSQWGAHRYAIVALDGRTYMPYGPGAVLLYLPGITAGRALHGLFGLSADKAAAFFCAFTSPVAAAITVALLYSTLRRLGLSARGAVAGCALYGLGTYALTYAGSTYYETPTAALFLLTFHLLSGPAPSIRNALVAGVAFAAAVSMKVACVVLAPAWLVLLAAPGGAASVRRAAAFVAPVAILGAALAAWNWSRFGSPFETGYGRFGAFSTPLPEGLYRITFASRAGWFVFSPALLLAVPGMRLLAARDRRAAVAVTVAVAAMLVVSATYWAPEGGTAYGARYLVPVTCLAAIPAAMALAASRGWARAACAVIVVVSVAIQLPSVVVPHQAYWQLREAHSEGDRDRLPSPVVADAILAREVIAGRDDPWDLGCLGVAPPGTTFRTVYPVLPGPNVWWMRAARNYGRPWAALGVLPLVALALFAAQRLRRNVLAG